MSSPHLQSSEAITPSLKRRALEYLELAGLEGALVGISTGSIAWDVRPVVIHEGQMMQLRILGPVAKLDQTLSSRVVSYFEKLKKHLPLFSWGDSDGTIWIARPYEQQTFASRDHLEEAKNEIGITGILTQILTELVAIKEQKLFHGHITASNMSCRDGKILLRDHGAAIFSPLSYSGSPVIFAPEVLANEPFDSAIDVFSFGLFVKATFPKTFEKHVEFFQRTLHVDPNERPSPEEILEYSAQMTHFFPAKESDTLRFYLSDVRSALQRVVPQGFFEQLFMKAKTVAMSLTALVRRSASPFSFRNKVMAVLATIAFLSVVGYYTFRTNYTALWLSGDPEKRIQVAHAAVIEGNRRAQAAVRNAVEEGVADADIAAPLLQRAYAFPWANRYDKKDNTVLFGIALGSVLQEAPALPDFSTLSPGAIIAIVGALPLDQSREWYVRVPLETFLKLPIPYDQPFALLQKEGVTTLQDESPRAVARIFSGVATPQVLKKYFGDTLTDQTFSQRLAALLPAVKQDETLLQTLLSFLEVNTGLSTWFLQESLNDWVKKPALYKLEILSGQKKIDQLTDTEVIDLLSLPLRSIRSALMERILSILDNKALMPTVAYLASKRNTLTRDQTISLVLALRVAGDSGNQLIEQWFALQPSDQAVVSLLLARGAPQGYDYFTVKAANYLKDKKWKASLPELVALTKHPEALIRTLAYTKLSAKNKEQKKVLQDAFAKETDVTLRKELQKMLEK